MFDDPKAEKWLKDQGRMIEEMGKSGVIASLCTEHYFEDPRCMLQIGASLCMNKPIVLIVLDGVKVPGKLLRVADKIIRTTHDKLDEASKELAEFVKGIPEKKSGMDPITGEEY